MLVYRSTVPPGTTEDVIIPLLEAASGRRAFSDFDVCFNPEFLREGSAVEDFYTPPFTVIGQRTDRPCTHLRSALQTRLVRWHARAVSTVLS